jgi:formate-nitrite transporter family protein
MPDPQEEAEQIARRSSPSGKIVHDAILQEGEDELARSSSALAWSGLAAGLSMGFSFLAIGLLRASLPDAPWRPLVASFGYTVGFLIVILGRQQLFTESTLTPVLPVLTGWSLDKLPALFRFWAVVLGTNLVGTWLFAWAIGHEWLFKPDVWKSLQTIADEALQDAFWPMAIKAVLAGWLIALMVWLMPAAASARFFVIITVTWLIAVAQFSHVIAGSVEGSFAALHGAISWSDYLVDFLVPAFIGNSLGGVVFVALLNHAQVKEEI